jgi:hypothetical protein
MTIRGWCSALLAGALISFCAYAEDPPPHQAPASMQALPSWAPGPLSNDAHLPPPGRVAARNIGVAFTLPESWRADDVSWRELDANEAKSLDPMAEYGLLVELAEADGSRVPLLTVFRVPLEGWRAAEREGKANVGRITLVDRDKGFVVVRPPDATGPGRYATLRQDLNFAIGGLVIFDAHHEERHLLAKIAPLFVGKLGDGSPVALHLEPGGNLRLIFGSDSRELAGRWAQRGPQIIGNLAMESGAANPTLLFHYDGSGLIVMKWDEKVFGNIGGRLDQPK